MKLIEIKKHFKGGTRLKYLFFKDDYPEEYIEESVLSWGEREGGGQVYGYKLEWNEVQNDEILKELIARRIKVIKAELQGLLSEGEELEEYLQHLNHK